MDPYLQMQQCLRLFKNAEPEIYEKFLTAVQAIKTDVTAAVIEAPQSDILVAQGRAQMITKLEQKVRELP